ncbi:MAG: hypothetical protein JXR73_05120 [Candidatus Omnitrophica bacterium]|nr:hypothetical protein [Candidatus Omnitrophota bacterium]
MKGQFASCLFHSRLIEIGLIISALSFLWIYSSATDESSKVFVAEKIVLQAPDGKMRAFLGVDGESSNLILFDKESNPIVTMTVLEDGTPGVVLMDKEGRSGIGMGVDGEGNANIGLLDANGRKRMAMEVDANGDSNLAFHNADGKMQLEISVNRKMHSVLNFFDEQELMKLSLGIKKNGSPILAFFDEKDIRIALGVLNENRASFVMSDHEGNSIIEIPQP